MYTVSILTKEREYKMAKLNKLILTLVVLTGISTSALAGSKQIIEDKTVKNYSTCVLMAGFAINPLYDKGLKPQKIVDSDQDQMMIYTVRVGSKTGFFTCTGNHYKVWVEDFSS